MEKFDTQAALDREEQVYNKLKGHFRHYCSDWDFMAIDETCPEFESCCCEFGERE